MEKYIKEFPRATWISLSVFLVLILIQFLMGRKIIFDNNLLVNFGYTMLYGYSLYFANSFVFQKLDTVFKSNRFTKKRLVIGAFTSFLISLLVIFLLRIFEDVVMENQSFTDFLANEKPSNYIVAIIITFIVTLGIHAFYFYKAYQENKVKEQKVIAGTASAQFESLKNQIDPHFLFNSLNVLSSLIEENPESAQKFTTSLSKIYRYVLEQKDKELVSVQEELNFAKTYMNLLKMRFEKSITYELPENFDNEDAKVVPLSLQLLLENCIKHNVVSESKPLHIKIYIENNQLVVENNLQKKEVLSERKGVGLQNIVNRYAILTDRKVLVDENESTFKVYLPVLTKQITIMKTQNYYNENMAYARARDRVEKIKGFYGNLISYCLVIPILIIVNFNTSKFQWFWFPMLGWGMGVFFHAMETFGYGKSWEERKIQEILKKEEQQKNKWN
ncbi:2TM domain-containing protein [Flavobacterium sp. UBA6135]|uniref:2TM domain-containing protein n=1 Tax=Flavobacterium sp. UBA6135 TaxID=1946553 RepID=UPI0025C03C4E|nr:2TM domain-containing protein [Flavobacterium sp. UBA6135]